MKVSLFISAVNKPWKEYPSIFMESLIDLLGGADIEDVDLNHVSKGILGSIVSAEADVDEPVSFHSDWFINKVVPAIKVIEDNTASSLIVELRLHNPDGADKVVTCNREPWNMTGIVYGNDGYPCSFRSINDPLTVS